MNVLSKVISIIILFVMTSGSQDSSNIYSSEVDFKSIEKSIYIGESIEPNRIYLESVNDQTNEIELNIEYPTKVNFVGIEESSKYFFKPFSEPVQLVGLYKIEEEFVRSQIGIGLSKYEIESVDRSRNGLIRDYSEKEYTEAVHIVEEDASISADQRTLDYMTIENTIVGAKEQFRIKLEDTEVEIVLSEYFTIGFEYAGKVYVIDIISNGAKCGTIEKLNLDGPY